MASHNPYHFGSPADDVHFTDRESELHKIKTLMLNGQNLVLIAPRRYGKSSLLRRALKDVSAKDARAGRVSLIRCSSERDVAETLLRGVLDGPLGWLRRHAEDLSRYLRTFRIQPEISVDPATGLFSASFAVGAAGMDWPQAITDTIRLLGTASDGAHPVAMILDEFQKAYEISSAIPDLMKDLVDELPDVSFVFAGSKRHVMEAMVNDPARGALYNIGDKLYLQAIPMKQFSKYLIARAAFGRKSMSRAVAESLYEAAIGVPNDVQLLAFWAYDGAGKAIEETDVRLALHTAMVDRGDEFRSLFDGLSLSQQLLLKMIAAQKVGQLSGADVRRFLGVSHTSARQAGDGLQRLELIQNRAGRWEVTSGLLKAWLVGDVE